MILSFKKMALGTLLALSLSVPALAQDVRVQTAVGEVDVPLKPKKVVVLDVGVLDNANHLGAADAIGMVPQFKYIKNIDFDTKNRQEGGTLFEPNFEAIAKYKPDLIIVATRSAKQREPLSKIAPTIDLTIDENNYMPSVKKQLSTLGAIFDKKAEAKQAIAQLEQKIAEAQKIVHAKGTGMLILVNDNKLSTTSEHSRFGWLYKYLHIKPAVPNLTKDVHGQPISFEFIKQHNPDWLLVFDRFAAIGKQGKAAKEVLDNALVHDTTAWKKQQIIYLDPAIYLQVGGLTGIYKNIDLVINAYQHK